MSDKNPPQQPTPQQPDGQRNDPKAPEQTVNLAALIQDNFGTSRSEVRAVIATGNVHVASDVGADFVPLEGDKFDVSRSKILEKWVRVFNDQRSYTFKYEG